jgi:hypothetical protein
MEITEENVIGKFKYYSTDAFKILTEQMVENYGRGILDFELDSPEICAEETLEKICFMEVLA